jgi:NCAIR mutase (PurE)-related protein
VRPEQIETLLADVAAGRLTPAAAMERLRHFPIEQLDFAQLDHHRALRQGQPEVVFCSGKTVDQVVSICERLAAASGGFLGTRASEAQAEALGRKFPALEWNRLGRTVLLWTQGTGTEARSARSTEARPQRGKEARLHRAARALQAPAVEAKLTGRPTTGTVLVVCAGTSDLPAAEEAAVTADAMGLGVERLTDVGVAGLHRLLAASDRLRSADVVIVVAGMEGALPSVVGGLIAAPVIAVPTSVGYGASFGGLAALLAMLNSCAAGVTVVNIDNGFGAAMAAMRMLAKPPA